VEQVDKKGENLILDAPAPQESACKPDAHPGTVGFGMFVKDEMSRYILDLNTW